jgi:hypothetical protein
MNKRKIKIKSSIPNLQAYFIKNENIKERKKYLNHSFSISNTKRKKEKKV